MIHKFRDSPIHKCLSVFLAFIFVFLILFVQVSADDVVPSPSPSSSPIRPNTPIGYQDGDTFRDIMLVVLDSWGINFSKTASDDTSILELNDRLMDQFFEENQILQDTFWDFVKYGVDETGNLILDFLGVNKIRQFANWLKDKFSLSDDSSVVVPVINSRENFLPYVNPITFDNVVSGDYSLWKAFVYPSGASSDGLYLATNNPSTRVACIVWTHYESNYVSGLLYASDSPAIFYDANEFNNPNKIVNLHNLNGYFDSNYGLYMASHTYPFPSGSSFVAPVWDSSCDSLVVSSYSEAINLALSLFGSSSITINTRSIDIPSEDLSPDDGYKIEIPGTNWGDSFWDILNLIERMIELYDDTQLNVNTVLELLNTLLQTLVTPTTIENIPGAVVLDYDEYDIPLETEWSLVDGFFSEETEGSPFSTLTTILYGLPEPFIIFFSVIIVFVVAYGFIRLGRDSH